MTAMLSAEYSEFDLGSRSGSERARGRPRRSSHIGFSSGSKEESERKRCTSESGDEDNHLNRRPSWWTGVVDEPQRQTSRIEFIDDRGTGEDTDDGGDEQEEGDVTDSTPSECSEVSKKVSTAEPQRSFPGLPFHILRRHKDSEAESMDSEFDELPVEPNLLRYVISLLGYSVNLGALWRFPYLFHKHGGGAFILAYAIVMLFIGLPVCFLETALGDFTSLGPVASWNCVPLMRGLGYASVAVCILVTLEMGVICSWIWHYLFLSFEAHVPWDYGDNTVDNTTSEELFFMEKVVQANSGVDSDGLGHICWELSLCLVLVWAVMFLYLLRSNIHVEQTYYISFIIPFIGLCIIFGAGLSVGRDIEGLQPIFSMTHKDLASGTLWLDAVSQLAWAFGMSNGVSVSVASLGMFPRSRGFSNTAIFLFVNMAISILASLTTSSHLGNIAHDMKKTVYTAVTPSLGSPFVLYTNGTTILPVSTMWAILFFLMLVGVGIHSLSVVTNTLLMFVLERGPAILKKRRPLTLAGICIVNMVLGLLFVTEGGLYLLTILDDYCTSWSVCAIAIMECVTITYLYGVRNWIKDLSALGNKLKITAWRITWGIIAPCGLLAVLIGSWVDYNTARFGGKELGWDMSSAANTAGIIIAVVPALIIPGYCIFRVFFSKGKTVRELLNPTPDWGPATKAKKWVLANLKSKYNINPDPILMVKVDSLHGIPMGFYRYPQSETTRQRKVSQEDLHKKLEGILKKKLSATHLPHFHHEDKVALTSDKPEDKLEATKEAQTQSSASTCTVESEISSKVRQPEIRVTLATEDSKEETDGKH